MNLDNEGIQSCGKYTYLEVIFYMTGNDNMEITRRQVDALMAVSYTHLWLDQ